MSGQLFVLLIVFGSMYWLYAMAHSGVSRRDRQYNSEDTEIIQELHRGMERMGKRIESLETILLDQGEHYRRTPPPLRDQDHSSRY